MVTGTWLPLPECIRDLLEECCLHCGDIVAPEEGEQTYCTIQNVSGCECLDGATFFPVSESYDGPPGGFCWETASQGAVWIFDETGSQACEPDSPGMTLSSFTMACCSPLDDSPSAFLISFEYGSGATAIAVLGTTRSTPLGFPVVVRFISFNPSPFELILEADVTGGIASPCSGGVLRFILTRS